MQCRCCQGEARRFGKFRNRNRVVQRFQCVRCGTTFSEEQPLENLRIETDKAVQVIHMLCEGIGIRAASRLSGLCQETVLNILAVAGRKCARLMDSKIRNVHSEFISVDELYSFVLTRPDNTPAEDEEHGAMFLFLSMDRDSKLILNHLVGKRTGSNCQALLQDLKGRVANRFQLSTDGFAGYRGRGWRNKGSVSNVFGNEIDYGTEIKYFGTPIPYKSSKTRVSRKFNSQVCIGVKREAVLGDPDYKKINTSHVERLNLSVRLFNRRFTRCTLGYSKTLENHKHAAAVLAAFYNFCRPHAAHGKSPAHASGLTDHTWTIEELIAN